MSKIVYRRYAGLFFCACVDTNDNELAYLEAIHFFVEVLDAFFGNVCELDLVFNFYKVSGYARSGREGCVGKPS
jgi:AP-2 complex subunit sigma-1